jgi:hypothetical protein
MKSAAGPILRRAGLLLEIACFLAYVARRDERRTIAGIAVSHLLISGLALGFLLWAVGLTLVLRDARERRRVVK